MKQLISLDAEEFQQLCAMIGMDKKPFHVMRFKKALDKHSFFPAHNTPSTLGSVQPMTNSVAASPQQLSQVPDNPTPQPIITNTAASTIPPVEQYQHQSPSNPGAEVFIPNSQPSSSNPAVAHHHLAQGGSVTLFLPPYLHPDADSTSNFDELIDDQTPVQKSLGSPPCKPSVWDSNRKSLIQKYAAIYGKNIDKRQKEFLSPFEEHVNEAAYQLCMRDPTLLVRRDELFLLSKRAVKEGGYAYYHGLSKSPESHGAVTPNTTPGQKRKRNDTPVGVDLTAVKFSKYTSMDTSSRLSSQERFNRMSTLKTLIEANKAQQAVKVAAMEAARRTNDFSAAFNLQLEVESLGTACQQLMTVYARLKRKQSRSDRYFRAKNREKDTNEPIDPQREGSMSEPGPCPPGEVFSPIPQIRMSSESDTSCDTGFQTNSVSAPHVVVIDDAMETQFFAGSPASTSLSLPSSSVARINRRKELKRNVTATILAPQEEESGNDDQFSDKRSKGMSSTTEIENLVNNVSNATNQVNSLLSSTGEQGNVYSSNLHDFF